MQRSVIQCSTYFLGFPPKTPKNENIWPKPRVSGQEPGFGPDVVTFGVNPSQNNRKLPHLAQTQVPGPRSWVWARCGKFLLFWDEKQPKITTSVPNPRFWAPEPGFGPSEKRPGLPPTITTSGPNPWFWAQNHGFGPDVVLFSLTAPGEAITLLAHYTPLQRTREGCAHAPPPPSLFSTSTCPNIELIQSVTPYWRNEPRMMASLPFLKFYVFRHPPPKNGVRAEMGLGG